MVRPVGFRSHSTTVVPLPPLIDREGTELNSHPKENMDIKFGAVKDFGHSTRSLEEVDRTLNTALTVGKSSRQGLPIFSKLDSQKHLPCTSSSTSQVC